MSVRDEFEQKYQSDMVEMDNQANCNDCDDYDPRAEMQIKSDDSEGTIHDALEQPTTTGLTVLNAVSNPFNTTPTNFKNFLEEWTENRKIFVSWVQSYLVPKIDFYTLKFKGRESKPSLSKAGSEKVCGLLRTTVSFPALSDYEQAAVAGKDIKIVMLKCLISSGGNVIAEGAGARKVSQDSGDINKSLKMAMKSAMIDATLRLGGLSEIFTQDIEDMDLNDDKDDSDGNKKPSSYRKNPMISKLSKEAIIELVKNKVFSPDERSQALQFCQNARESEAQEKIFHLKAVIEYLELMQNDVFNQLERDKADARARISKADELQTLIGKVKRIIDKRLSSAADESGRESLRTGTEG